MEGSSPRPPGRGSHGGILSRGRPPQRRRGALATGTQAAPGLCCRVPLKGTWRAASAFACSCRHVGVEVGGWACRLRPAPERPRGRSRSEWSCPASHSYNWGAWWAASACACAGRHMGLWSRSVELPRGQQAVDHDAWSTLGVFQGEVPCPPQEAGGQEGPQRRVGGWAPRRRPGGDVVLSRHRLAPSLIFCERGGAAGSGRRAIRASH